VSKHTPGSEDAITATDVTSVDGEDRLRELARMLSGQEESEAALRHAAELLERATVQR
jgi:DNA repair protein RecN (Recombination protein N)